MEKVLLRKCRKRNAHLPHLSEEVYYCPGRPHPNSEPEIFWMNCIRTEIHFAHFWQTLFNEFHCEGVRP